MKKTLAQLFTPRNFLFNSRIYFSQEALRSSLSISSIFALVIAMLISFTSISTSTAQVASNPIRMVRELELDELSIQNPAAIAYSQRANVFHVVESNSSSSLPSGYSDIVTITVVEEQIGSARIPAAITDSKNTTFDNNFNRLLNLQTNSNRLISVDATLDGALDSSSLKRHDVRDFDIQDPQGMAVDPASGQVYILDSAVPHIVSIKPAANGSFSGAEISHFPLKSNSYAGLGGLAYDPTNGHFFVVNQAIQVLYEFNGDGYLVASRDISSFDFVNPQSMVFAPSGDPTDDPAITNLYLVDAKSTSEPANNLLATETELLLQESSASAGRIVELSMHPLPQLSDAVPTDSVILERTTDTFAFSPPSPDPSGLTNFASNKLLISDGEVNELVPPNPAAYTGINLFITTRVGSLDSTLTTYDPPDIDFSDEPTGAAYNSSNGFLYFSDDTGTKGVYELDPSTDGLYNTSDDLVTFFGNVGIDPEGIAFDDSSRVYEHLFVVDGVGKEVYDINLGSNGTLDQSDSVTHFDVYSKGLNDPEGIEINPDNDHLYILDSSSTDRIAETTIDGTLLRYLDISATNALYPAGLAYAPASDGSGRNNLYIVDRGEDNDDDPNENDGKMYEISFPIEVNVPPEVNAGTDQAISFGDTANLDGTVSDDGNPDPPGTVTTLWSVISRPQTGAVVTFGNPSLVDTTATFSVLGEYVLRLTADDSEQTNYDEITITVDLNQPPNVSAGLNQVITLPEIATLDGTVTDDDLPFPPNITTEWTESSELGSVTFADASAEDTTASFSAEGIYFLRLTADDTELTNYDEVTITVNSAPNQPPSVDAGHNQTITLPASAILDGTVTDDGLPFPPGSYTTNWSVVSGPGLVSFDDASAVDTTAHFSLDGVYELLLTADDSEKSAINSILISVNPAPVKYVWLPMILLMSTDR